MVLSSVPEAEDVGHVVATRGLVAGPERGADRALREKAAVFRAMDQLQPLTLPRDNDGVIADDGAAA